MLHPGRQEEDDEDEKANVPPLPGQKLHQCTDVLCLLVLAAVLVHWFTTVTYAYEKGNISRLFHGKNWKGEMCGFGGRGEFVYWCKNAAGFIDLHHPLCIEACPASNQTTTDCVDAEHHKNSNDEVVLTQTRDYPSKPFLWFYCLPEDAELMHEVIGRLLGGSVKDAFIRCVSQVAKAAYPILAAAAFAVLMGFTWIFLLGNCAGCILRLTLVAIVVGPLGLGAFFIYVSQTGGSDQVIGTGDSQSDLYVGAASIVAGLLVGVVAWCLSSGISTAVGCIEATSECIFQSPSILLEPIMSLVLKVGFVPIFKGLLLLVSCRDGQWNRKEQLFMAEYIFVVIWLLEMSHAVSQYSLCFAAQLWYFTPYDSTGMKQGVPSFGVIQGYCNALIFHGGSLALSAFLFTLFRWVAFLLRAITSAVPEDSTNPVLAAISRGCYVYAECYRNTLAFLNTNAYMDMAISSSSFCVASERALEIIYEEVPAVAMLNGAQFIFLVAGAAFVSLGSGMVTLIMTESVDIFSNPESTSYISDPKPVAFTAGFVGGLIAINFMHVFDTVGDTILYCFAVDQRRLNNLERDSQKSDGVGLFGWFFGGGEDEEATVETTSIFAPARLRDLIAAEHESLMEKPTAAQPQLNG